MKLWRLGSRRKRRLVENLAAILKGHYYGKENTIMVSKLYLDFKGAKHNHFYLQPSLRRKDIIVQIWQ